MQTYATQYLCHWDLALRREKNSSIDGETCPHIHRILYDYTANGHWPVRVFSSVSLISCVVFRPLPWKYFGPRSTVS